MLAPLILLITSLTVGWVLLVGYTHGWNNRNPVKKTLKKMKKVRPLGKVMYAISLVFVIPLYAIFVIYVFGIIGSISIFCTWFWEKYCA